jgi:hypothetical protein
VKIKLKINRVADRHRQRRGSIVDLPADEAQTLIASGRAIAVQEGPPPLKPVRKKKDSA